MGVQPGCAQKGVCDTTYHVNKIPPEHWNNVVETLSKNETVMLSYLTTVERRRLNLGREIIGFKMMSQINNDEFILQYKIFGGVAFSLNVHLSIHTDEDFSLSCVRLRGDSPVSIYRSISCLFVFLTMAWYCRCSTVG